MIRWAIKLWNAPMPRWQSLTLYTILTAYAAVEIIRAWEDGITWAVFAYAAILLVALTVLWLHWHDAPLRIVAPFCKATGAKLGTRAHRAKHRRLGVPCRRQWRQHLPRVERTRRRMRVTEGGAR